MTDWTYREAWSRRMFDKPRLEPAGDPIWRLLLDGQPRDRLVASWVDGHMRLCRRWRVDTHLGTLPTTFRHVGDAIAIEIGGVLARSVPVRELLDRERA